MKELSVTIDVDATPERVFAVLCDVETWPQWTATVTSVQRLDSGPFALGSRARVQQPKLMPAVWQVTEMDATRGFTWVTRSPGMQITAGHAIQKRGTGSRVVLSLVFSGLLGSLAARLYGSVSRRYLETEARSLKARSEG